MLLPLVKREYKMNWNYQKAQSKAILKSQIETRKGQLEINEKEVIEKLDIMREQLGLEKIKMDVEKDRLMVDTVLGLMEAASKMVKPGS